MTTIATSIKRIIAPAIVVVAFAFVAACSGGDGNGETSDTADGGNLTTPASESAAEDDATDTDSEDGSEGDEGAIGEEPSVSFAEGCQKTDEEQFSEPEQLIDTSKTYVATITLEKGDIVLELFSDVPITTNSFVFLACKGFYDGLTFHRVIDKFVAQGGDPTGTGSGGPGYSIPDEDSAGHRMEAGVISMAKSGPDTTGSQFFITYTPQEQLEADFTVFGRVTDGMDVAQQITRREPGPNAPPGDVIETITIEER